MHARLQVSFLILPSVCTWSISQRRNAWAESRQMGELVLKIWHCRLMKWLLHIVTTQHTYTSQIKYEMTPACSAPKFPCMAYNQCKQQKLHMHTAHHALSLTGLGAEHSFNDGAMCLLHLMQDRKTRPDAKILRTGGKYTSTQGIHQIFHNLHTHAH